MADAVSFPLTEPLLTDLEQRVLAEMAAAWNRGERLGAEELLCRYPALADLPGRAVRLIGEEVRLRQRSGEEVASDEVLRRFPRWGGELSVMLECRHRLREQCEPSLFPHVGQSLGGFVLLGELGRGAEGRVFLAAEPALGGRPVVLKVTPRHDREYLSLCRLQHTHVIPLYGVYDIPERNLRALCMPYFGGATLSRVLAALGPIPAERRTGADLVAALDRSGCGPPQPQPAGGGPRHFLAGLSYADAVCWIGVCLAEALHYAHERGLAHLDLKPSNVLLGGDGQPYLLDFHLAHAPLNAGQPVPRSLGGTRGYMSPEQEAAFDAGCEGRPLPADLGHRSDVFSLGRLLCIALTGATDATPEAALPASPHHPHISVGLADLLRRCLAPEPADRYPSAGALAADLRRHLAHEPLCGVANRSMPERWREWRRRRPHAPLWAGFLLALLAVPLVLAGVAQSRLNEARTALREGREQLRGRRFSEAARTLTRGKDHVRGLPGCRDLRQELAHWHERARRAAAADHLHAVAEQLRFMIGTDLYADADLRILEEECRTVWHDRGVLARVGAVLDDPAEERIRTDLADLDRLLGDLQRRLTPGASAAPPDPGPDRPGRRTWWEHAERGRALLRAGAWDRAAAELGRAAELRPQDFWSHFHGGVAAYRGGRPADAVQAFSVALALAPEVPEVHYNRALAQAAAGRADAAARDLERALTLKPALAPAATTHALLAKLRETEARYSP